MIPTELAMAERSWKRGVRDVTEAQANYVASCKRHGGNRVLWEKLAHAEKIAAQRRHQYYKVMGEALTRSEKLIPVPPK